MSMAITMIVSTKFITFNPTKTRPGRIPSLGSPVYQKQTLGQVRSCNLSKITKLSKVKNLSKIALSGSRKGFQINLLDTKDTGQFWLNDESNQICFFQF